MEEEKRRRGKGTQFGIFESNPGSAGERDMTSILRSTLSSTDKVGKLTKLQTPQQDSAMN
jgi:hypothetical protein